METIDAITSRSSIREYDDKEIPKELLKRLVDAGRRAPTARAVEPWEMVVITDKDALNRLSRIATSGSFIEGCRACIAVYCKDTKYYLEDGCAATENILLAATDMGLGSCWVAGDKKPYAGEVSRFLNVPEEYRLVSMISLGWPRQETKQVKRRSADEVIHWERF